jgi:hypothetical protein
MSHRKELTTRIPTLTRGIACAAGRRLTATDLRLQKPHRYCDSQYSSSKSWGGMNKNPSTFSASGPIHSLWWQVGQIADLSSSWMSHSSMHSRWNAWWQGRLMIEVASSNHNLIQTRHSSCKFDSTCGWSLCSKKQSSVGVGISGMFCCDIAKSVGMLSLMK